MAEDAEQSSSSLSTSEEFEIVSPAESRLIKSEEKLNKRSLDEKSKAAEDESAVVIFCYLLKLTH